MAEKGFGVKEVNLIGASGTPTITSPNNINLNAANVAISTNVSVGGTMTVTGGGSFGIGSTVGIGSTLYVSHGDLYLRDNHQLNINNDALTMRGNNGGNGFITNAIGDLYITSLGDIQEDAVDNFSVKTNTNEQAILATKNGSVALYHDGGNKKIETSSSGATVTGTLVATTFSGSGASLTNLPAANLTGTLPAISGANLTNLPADTPTNTDIQVVYTVTANGSSAYRFGGNGIVSTADNPDVYLIRGLKYRFINNSGGSHPFQIRHSSGGSAYSAGVTNNGAASGNIDFQVPYSAPSRLYYQCTSHGGMVGNLYIRGANGQNDNVGVTTFTALTTFQLASGGNLVEPLRLRNAATGANTDVGMIFYNDGAGTIARIKAYDAGTYNGGLIFETAPTAGSLNNNTSEALRINEQGRVMINTTNSASRTLNLKGTFGILSTNQSGVIDMSISDAGAAVIAPYVSGGSSLELKTNASGSGVSTRLKITSSGNLLPGADNSQDLGSSSLRWANIYSADLQLSNVGTGGNEVDGTEGKWTLQEAEDTVYMINRINGKRYKIKMEEV